MTFFGIDEGRIVQQIMPELQKVTTSFEWLMHVLAWSVAIHLMIHIWRQWKNIKRVSEVQARISAKQLGISSEVEDLTRENQALKLAVRLQRKAIKKSSRVCRFCVSSKSTISVKFQKNRELKNLVVACAEVRKRFHGFPNVHFNPMYAVSRAYAFRVSGEGRRITGNERQLWKNSKRKLSRRLVFWGELKFLRQAMSSVETTIQCQVCMELLHRPQVYVFSTAGLENELKSLII